MKEIVFRLYKLPAAKSGQRCVVVAGVFSGVWEGYRMSYPSRWTGSYLGDPQWRLVRKWYIPHHRDVLNRLNPFWWGERLARLAYEKRTGYRGIRPPGHKLGHGVRTQIVNTAAYLRAAIRTITP